MLNVICNYRFETLLSENGLATILDNDPYLTDDLLLNDIIYFEGEEILLNIPKLFRFIQSIDKKKYFFIEGNKTIHWTYKNKVINIILFFILYFFAFLNYLYIIYMF